MIGPAEIQDMLLDLEAAEAERSAAPATAGTTKVGEGEIAPPQAVLQSPRLCGDAFARRSAEAP